MNEWTKHDLIIAQMADINRRMVHPAPIRQPVPKRTVRTDGSFVRLMALLGMFAFVFVMAFLFAL